MKHSFGIRKSTPKINKNILKTFLQIFDLSTIPSKWQLFLKHFVIISDFEGSNIPYKKASFFSAAFITTISRMYSESSRASKKKVFAKIIDG